VADKGILGEPRYFGRISSRTGKPARRQLSLIEREQIAEHAAALGLETIPPGAVRANIETLGISLVELAGQPIEIGGAILLVGDPRTPCERMDAVCPGLRALMEKNRQGVLAQVVKSGRIEVNAPIRLAKMPPTA
jgi:MOSC domain-containing protein YiiM